MILGILPDHTRVLRLPRSTGVESIPLPLEPQQPLVKASSDSLGLDHGVLWKVVAKYDPFRGGCRQVLSFLDLAHDGLDITVHRIAGFGSWDPVINLERSGHFRDRGNCVEAK